MLLSQALLKLFRREFLIFTRAPNCGTCAWSIPITGGPSISFQRSSMLAALKEHPESSASFTDQLMEHWQDGKIKLYAIWKALNFRREQSKLFSQGDYLQLEATGQRGNMFCNTASP